MAWTEDRVELLKKLWAEGLSASQVANRLGGCTRNSVIGKVSRLGLPGRATTSRAKSPKRRNPRMGQVTQTQQPSSPYGVAAPLEPICEAQVDLAPAPIEDIVMPRLGRLAIITLTERTCRWPIGDPGDADFHFCARESPLGVPYCAQHTCIATAPAQPRRRGGSAAAR